MKTRVVECVMCGKHKGTNGKYHELTALEMVIMIIKKETIETLGGVCEDCQEAQNDEKRETAEKI